jgi:hypothetical protein
MWDYAVKAWLTCFLGFVDNLADCLWTYSAGLAGAANVYAADQLEDKPLNPCGPYYILLLQLWTSCDSGQVSKADYEWFCTCACTTMSEVTKAASAGASSPSMVPAVVVPAAALVAPSPRPSPVVHPLLSAPAIQTLPVAFNLGGSSSDEVIVVGHPELHLLLPGSAPVASGSGSRSRKRACPVVTVPGQVCNVCLPVHSVVPAYMSHSAFSVKQAICNVRMGRLPGHVFGALIQVVCACVLLVSPVSCLLVPSWCCCLHLQWHLRHPLLLLCLQPQLLGLLLPL